VKVGVRGVRAVTVPSDRVRIMLHIDCGGDWPVTRWYFDHVAEHNVEFDLIGQSYYPRWHGTLEDVRNNLRETAQRYRKDIVIVETAYPWKNADAWARRKNMAWPVSREGQKQFMVDLIQAVRETPDGHGLGVVYWHPESVAVRSPSSSRPSSSRPSSSRPSSWNAGAMALFDDDGVALPAMDVLGARRP
jgi:arabinogalactan endo-1,4-beta-galactosidase